MARGAWFLPSISDTGRGRERCWDPVCGKKLFSFWVITWLIRQGHWAPFRACQERHQWYFNKSVYYLSGSCNVRPTHLLQLAPRGAPPEASSFLYTVCMSLLQSLFQWAAHPWKTESASGSWIHAGGVTLSFPNMILKNGLPSAQSLAWNSRGTCVLKNSLIFMRTWFRGLVPGSK